MKCPYCQTPESKVIDSRNNQTAATTRRRRECPKCGGRFTTYERVEELMPLVIKKDGRREAYSREKLSNGIKLACQKRSVPIQKLDEAVVKIEKQMQSIGLKEIPSRNVGELVMRELNHLDKVAYIRFASVYRDFRDVEEFVNEIREPLPLVDESGAMTFPFIQNQNETSS